MRTPSSTRRNRKGANDAIALPTFNISGTILTSLVALFGAGHAHAARAQAAGSAATVPATPPDPSFKLIATYCLTCHNEKLKTAGLVLEKLDAVGLPSDSAIGEKVLKKLRADAMPPPGRPHPDAATRATFVSRLELALDGLTAAAPNPGRVAARRMNRSEYVNAVRDLLDLEIDGRAMLPPDDTGYGFDNIADVLSRSPSLLERYLLAADKISSLAVGNPRMRPDVMTYTVPKGLRQDDTRVSDGLPVGSRGGTAVRHLFPVD